VNHHKGCGDLVKWMFASSWFCTDSSRVGAKNGASVLVL
jgi:hypothetical protein